MRGDREMNKNLIMWIWRSTWSASTELMLKFKGQNFSVETRIILMIIGRDIISHTAQVTFLVLFRFSFY